MNYSIYSAETSATHLLVSAAWADGGLTPPPLLEESNPPKLTQTLVCGAGLYLQDL